MNEKYKIENTGFVMRSKRSKWAHRMLSKKQENEDTFLGIVCRNQEDDTVIFSTLPSPGSANQPPPPRPVNQPFPRPKIQLPSTRSKNVPSSPGPVNKPPPRRHQMPSPKHQKQSPRPEDQKPEKIMGGGYKDP